MTTSAPEAPGFVNFATLPGNCAGLVVISENAKVKISRSATGSGITVASNCPRNWSVKDNVIRQAGFSKVRPGVAMMADSLGSRAIVNGKVYILPTGPVRGISMGKDGVSVGGQKLEPLAGSDIPGNCGEGPDALQITVPESYAGDLVLGIASDSELNLESWKGGKVECTIVGKSVLSATKLKSLAKAVLDVRGEGKAEIGDLSTKVLVANISGSGSVTIKNGSADISNATVAGNGSINMKGTYKNLQKQVEGQGKIQVSN